MKTFAFALTLLILPVSPALSAAKPGCGLAPAPYIGPFIDMLGLRAVEAVNLAGAPAGASDVRLKQLVHEDAPFSLGSGDVGRPLGTGVAGARALHREMKADSFRFLGRDGIPMPVEDVCGRHEVTVEFTDTRRGLTFPMRIVFEAGRIRSAEGWTRSFKAGAMAGVGP